MSDPILDTDWDVIVIGTGIGGGTAGRALAEAGLKTLFLEKGPAGHRAERTPLTHEIFLPEARLARGFWPGQIVARENGHESRFYGPLGAGVGGSSVFYAATLERPEPHDLDDSADKPHPTGGWPVSFTDFAPYLARAEALYHVSGSPHAPGQDHLAPPRPFTPADQRIADTLQKNGHAPYALHSAIRHVEGCLDCQGKCPLPCKMDGRSAGVEPALATGNAALLDRCEVTRLGTDGTRITHVDALHNDRPISLSARHVVLAGGAFGSPRLCLASAGESHPKGVANSSGLVGRNLMFHLNELFALWPGTPDPAPSKAIGLRDLYHLDGERLGMVQAMGVTASYGEITYYLRNLIDRSALRHVPLAGELSRIPAAIAARMLGSAKIFVGLLEDLPYEENRVLPPAEPGSDEITFTYTMHPELARRRSAFRRAIRRAFRGQRRMFLNRAPDLNHGHPTGTMRFGTDPATSVLDPWGRSHDHPNLWVADAGFMPSSMGVNPSLSIAAQALRAADAIKEARP